MPDYFGFLWIPLVSLVGGIATILLLAWLAFRYIKDDEIRAFIRPVVIVLVILSVGGFALAAMNTAAVHLPRTTIDRSVSDEQQEKLEQRLYREGQRPK